MENPKLSRGQPANDHNAGCMYNMYTMNQCDVNQGCPSSRSEVGEQAYTSIIVGTGFGLP